MSELDERPPCGTGIRRLEKGHLRLADMISP